MEKGRQAAITVAKHQGLEIIENEMKALRKKLEYHRTSPCLILVCVLVPQSCLTLWDPMDCSPPGSSVHGILQARILENTWLPCPSPGESSHPRDQTQVSHTAGRFFTVWASCFSSVWLFVTYERQPPGKNTGVGFHFLLQGDWTWVSQVSGIEGWVLYH